MNLVSISVVFLGVALALLTWNPSTRKSAADFIFTNCTIWTADDDSPLVHSMAVSNGRVLRVGDVRDTAGPQTQYIDLHGQFVVPGFIDSHVHFIPGGLQLGKLDLRDVHSRTEFENRVHEAIAALSDEEDWLLGSGWSNEHWGGEWPTSSWIDSVTGNHPVWLTRIDGHMGLANKVALDKCKLMDVKDDPAGGSILRDNEGVPTGLLADTAMLLVASCLPKPTLQQRRAALLRASRHAASNGITSVVDFGSYFPGESPEQLWIDFDEVYTWTDALGQMTVRCALFFPLETWRRVSALVREKGQALSNWIHIRGVKAFADGSLGSGTALFHEAYADDSTNFGLRLTELDYLSESATFASETGLQVAIHAIGDRAVDDVLSLYRDIAAKYPDRELRLRVEHAQHLSPGAEATFSKSSIVASVQPEQLLDDAPYAAKKLGEERSQRSYSFNSLLRNGTVLALGSDWPVAALNPLGGIAAAVERTPDGWKTPWLPEQRISVEDALKGYTISAAYAARLDELVGSLKVGKLADFVVLSESPFKGSPRVVATYVGGSKVYSD